MRVRALITLLACLGLLFVLLPAAHANIQVQLYFTGATSGGDLDPYQIIISQVGTNPTIGTTQWLNCDDHNDLVSGGEHWIADVIAGTDNAGLLTTRMSKLNMNPGALYNPNYDALIAYDAKAYLELHYGAANNPDYSNALWAIFDKNWTIGFNSLYTESMNAAIADVGTGYFTYRQHLTIYSPDQTCSTCKPIADGGTWTYGVPQEFNAVTVPDGGVTLMLLGGALFGLETLRRRFRV